MIQSDPGFSEMLINETSVLQLVQSHLEDERECIKEVASLAMELLLSVS